MSAITPLSGAKRTSSARGGGWGSYKVGFRDQYARTRASWGFTWVIPLCAGKTDRGAVPGLERAAPAWSVRSRARLAAGPKTLEGRARIAEGPA